MYKLLHSRSFYITTALATIGFVGLLVFIMSQKEPEKMVSTVVETGPVRQIVSVSGIAEADQSAELAFPVSGIVQSVRIKKGAVVAAGDILVTLDQQALQADRQDALAQIAQATANRDELLNGPTISARDVTKQTIEQAEESLQTTRDNEARKIKNAYQALLSGDVTVYSEDSGEDALPPTVSGSYTCEQEGTYRLEVFNSGATSGYSYYLSGIESGTYSVSTQQAIALGNCGLRIQFDANSKYTRTVWMIDIPNTKSASYISNRNTYALAVTQAESAIANAEQALTLAQSSATNVNADPRAEAVTRANATIAQAQARLTRIDSTMSDRVLTAPFAGTVTEIDILPGELVTNAPVVTLLAETDFKITARIPEIDIGKVAVGQTVNLVFDAKSDEELTGTIDYLSLQATELDGVAYYEATVSLDTNPDWLRTGLNADIDIVIVEATEHLRIPKRFLVKTETGYAVLKESAGTYATTTVQVQLEGNDGYVAITGLEAGDILVAQ